MANASIEEALDEVLDILAIAQNGIEADILKDKATPVINGYELLGLCKILKGRGYIDAYYAKGKNNDTVEYYKITHNGWAFISLSGFVKEKENVEATKEALEIAKRTETHAIKNIEISNNALTWAMISGIAAIIGVLFSIFNVEIILFLKILFDFI